MFTEFISVETNMEHHQRLGLLRSVMAELSSAHAAAVFCIERMNELLASDEWRESDAETNLPVADSTQYAIHWRGRTCFLGPTKPFFLFLQLLRRVDQYVPADALLRSAWMGDQRAPATIRSAVRVLKRKLDRARMRALARSITGTGNGYGMMLRKQRLR